MKFDVSIPPGGRKGLFTLILLAFLALPARGQVILNEVMAENVTTLANEDEFPDWVELYNTSETAVDLSTWTLTDTLSNPAKYQFPAGTVIGPGEYLLVFCDESTDLPGLHAGFALDGKGEAIAIYSPANPFAPHDVVSFGLQVTDFSIGRIPEFTGAWRLNDPTPEEPNRETALSSSTNLFLNEWMADDPGEDDWLELFNAGAQPAEISGFVFTDDLGVPANRALPNLSFIFGRGFIQFIADDLDQDDNDHLDFQLSSNGETLTLYEPDRVTVVDRVTFGAQVEGASQGRLPDGDQTLVSFEGDRATPGASNFLPLTDVAINEVLAHTDPPLEDAIELINMSALPVDISYWWLSDSPSDVKKYRIPAGTVIGVGEFKVFYEVDFGTNNPGTSMGFSLNSSEGEEVYLHSANVAGDLTGFRSNVAFPATQNGVSLGRFTNSVGEVFFTTMRSRTFGVDDPASLEEFRTGTGLPNAEPRVGPLVFQEIMYHPPEGIEGGDNTDDEYLEILNITNGVVNLYDPNFPTNRFRIQGGVEFEFPQSVSLAAGATLLVVNFDPVVETVRLAEFRALYNVPASTPIYGPYGGNLSNRGELIELMRPDTPQGPNSPNFGFVPYLLVDAVEYEDRDPWPVEPDELGAALVRIVPDAYGNDPNNWGAADPSPGRDTLRIDSVSVEGGALVIAFEARANQSYSVQYRSSVANGPWLELSEVAAEPATRVVEVTDPAVGSSPARFYRLVTPAQ